MRKISNIAYVRNVTVILGRKCNGKCVYCAQSGLSSVEDKIFNSDIIVFLSKLTKVPRKDKNDKLQIILYGGEPLLYWSILKKIVEGVVNSRETVQGNYYFKIFTNGVFLNEEIVKFLNMYDVYVVLGYDGPYEDTRPVRLRDEQIPLFLRIKHKSVSFVVSAKNNDILTSALYLKNKFGKNVSIDNAAMCSYFNGDVGITDYFVDDYKMYYHRILSVMVYYEKHPVDSLFWHFVRGMFRTNSLMQDKIDFFSIDISGNMYGFSDKEDSFVCTIYDNGVEKILDYRRSLHPKCCYSCAYSYYCRCYYGVEDKDEIVYNCRGAKMIIGILELMRPRILSILARPENRRFLEQLSSNWRIG